ncbi:MAG: hypothetical protein GX442_04300 [Candidatus Riflebacteria bacterium]|nr:hypothetical protein [Candidatus Riflebacteria bacterium]
MSKTSWRMILLVVFLAMSVCPAPGQILTVDPEADPLPVHKVRHLGTTLSGTSGLITIPTPDFQDERKVSATYKGGLTKRDVTFNNTRYRTTKAEHFTGAAWNVKENLELSVLNLRYDRSSSPNLPGLNYYEDATTFGLKYSAHNNEQDLCMGVSFAPMDALEMNRADLFQIEHLRNVYLTVSEEIASSCYGYLSLKDCFTDKQKVDLGRGQIVEMSPKQFLVSGVGLEYCWNESVSLFCEGKFSNYRDLFNEDATRFSLNAGLRFGFKNAQAEILGMSLDSDPFTYFGGSIGF